jgi:uncharacterized protein (TIGR02466 family)|tara:strand:+ start:228 stop:815 length:588 start_codon:yes stop_codon:yes gene_type:complete
MKKTVFPLFSTPLFEVTDLPLDNKKIAKFFINYAKKNKSRILTNEGGYQSNDVKDVSNPEFDKFKALLFEAAKEYSRILEIEEISKFAQIWFNINQKTHFNNSHKHLNSMFSGVYYVKAPKNSGNLSFKHNVNDFQYAWNHFNPIKPKQFNMFNSGTWIIKPSAGNLYLFPCWAEHMVGINESKEERISIAFDII